MNDKRVQAQQAAQLAFRQFAWNLAGTLASVKAGAGRKPSPRPGKR